MGREADDVGRKLHPSVKGDSRACTVILLMQHLTTANQSVSIGGVDPPVDEDMKMLLTISLSTLHAGIALCTTLQ